MTVPAAADYRTYPVVTLPVFDLRTGDVVFGTDSEVIGIDAESPWSRRIVERHPLGQITRFTYDCADELTVYRKPPAESAADSGAESAPSARTGRPAGIRCPHCGNVSAFAVQLTVNVVLDGDLDVIGSPQASSDQCSARLTGPGDGFRGDEPVQCQQDRGGCGHRGSVEQFRVRAEDSAVE